MFEPSAREMLAAYRRTLRIQRIIEPRTMDEVMKEVYTEPLWSQAREVTLDLYSELRRRGG